MRNVNQQSSHNTDDDERRRRQQQTNLPRVVGESERRETIELRYELRDLCAPVHTQCAVRSFDCSIVVGCVGETLRMRSDAVWVGHLDECCQLVAAQIEHFQIANCANSSVIVRLFVCQNRKNTNTVIDCYSSLFWTCFQSQTGHCRQRVATKIPTSTPRNNKTNRKKTQIRQSERERERER